MESLKIECDEQERVLEQITAELEKDTLRCRTSANNHADIEFSSNDATGNGTENLLKGHQKLKKDSAEYNGKIGKLLEQHNFLPVVATETNTPEHIAIIMDGNGRWATRKGLRREDGHIAGAEVVEKIVESCFRKGIKFLTLYAFSSDNWRRPRSEVSNLMSMMRKFLIERTERLVSKGIKILVIGDISRFDPDLQELIRYAVSTSAHNKYPVIVAVNYGARNEIRHAALEMCKYVTSHKIQPNNISNKLFDDFIDSDIPNPDLLIRTGGEKRVSDFLLWQIAYTELYFTDVLWPDFSEADLSDAIKDFSYRHRRFGKSN